MNKKQELLNKVWNVAVPNLLVYKLTEQVIEVVNYLDVGALVARYVHYSSYKISTLVWFSDPNPYLNVTKVLNKVEVNVYGLVHPYPSGFVSEDKLTMCCRGATIQPAITTDELVQSIEESRVLLRTKILLAN